MPLGNELHPAALKSLKEKINKESWEKAIGESWKSFYNSNVDAYVIQPDMGMKLDMILEELQNLREVIGRHVLQSEYNKLTAEFDRIIKKR